MNTLEETAAYEAPPQEHGRRTMKFTYAPESRPLSGYTIKRGIQRGGFGEVYYAVSDSGKEVALKLLQNNMEVELRGVSQCLNLKHPNLVTIYDIRQDADGDHWIVMEYVHGKNLDQSIHDRPGQMPVEEVLQWLGGVAAGLTFLHERGIVHRDLKPANVYRENGIVKIGDVGLSKFITESRRHAQTQSVGTVYYMAPEVGRGQYGREVDVYALGVVLYEMLTGRVPFDGESTAEILMKHLAEKPNLEPIPHRLRPVLARALEKDPMRRTPSAKHLEEEFRAAVLGFENSVSPPPLPVNDASRPVPVPVRVEAPRHEHPGTTYPPRADRHVDGRPSASQLLGLLGLAVLWVMIVSGAVLDRSPLARVAALGAVSFGIFQLVTTTFKPKRRTGMAAARAAWHGGRGCGAADGMVPLAVRHRPLHRRLKLTPYTRRKIPARLRALELTGAMTFAAFATALITAGLAVFASFLASPSEIALFGITTLLGTWGILVPSKVVEGTRIEGGTRRFFQLGSGLAVGFAAAWLAHVLFVHVGDNPFDRDHHGWLDRVGDVRLWAYGEGPTMAGYMAFFGSLFLLRHWWMHSDAFRKRRFRVSSLLLTMGLGYLLSLLWSFPPLWGTMWAGAISTVVQLSAVWMPPEERERLVVEQRHAVA